LRAVVQIAFDPAQLGGLHLQRAGSRLGQHGDPPGEAAASPSGGQQEVDPGVPARQPVTARGCDQYDDEAEQHDDERVVGAADQDDDTGQRVVRDEPPPDRHADDGQRQRPHRRAEYQHPRPEERLAEQPQHSSAGWERTRFAPGGISAST
jgi:hypothetical protein